MEENQNQKQKLDALTKSFIQILQSSNGYEITLDDACKRLNAQRRRLYDVVNVLIGVGLVEKVGKSRIKWIGDISSVTAPMTHNSLIKKNQDVTDMINEVEKCLNDLINSQLYKNYSWISENDLLSIFPNEPGMYYYILNGPASTSLTVLEEKDQPSHIVVSSADGKIEFTPINTGNI